MPAPTSAAAAAAAAYPGPVSGPSAAYPEAVAAAAAAAACTGVPSSDMRSQPASEEVLSELRVGSVALLRLRSPVPPLVLAARRRASCTRQLLWRRGGGGVRDGVEMQAGGWTGRREGWQSVWCDAWAGL
jgi:hypothetical protein